MSLEHAALKALADYYSAFSTQDLRAILPYFDEPAMIIAPSGVFAVPDSTTLAAVIKPTLEGLRARGYARSDLILKQLSTIGDGAAIVSGIAIRYKADDQELERVTLSYVLRQTGTAWRIAVMIFHDAAGAAS